MIAIETRCLGPTNTKPDGSYLVEGTTKRGMVFVFHRADQARGPKL